jgi:hypothetical protein
MMWRSGVDWPGAAREGRINVYVSLTRVSTSGQPIGNATIIAQEMIRWFRATDGFQGLLFLSKEGTTLALTFWDDREVADRHRASRMQFRDRVTEVAGVQVEETLDYEVTFAHLGPLRMHSWE